MSYKFENSSQVSPNVYGIETEYSCMVVLPGLVTHELVGSCHSLDVKLGLYHEPKGKGTADVSEDSINDALKSMELYRNSAGMMSNGARFYMDPSGPEYATPETRTAEEATHRMFDGDAVVQGIFQHLQETNEIEGYQINRRIVDHNRTSRGIHLNTITSLDEEPDQSTITNLAALNVVKGAIFGSGGLLLDEYGKSAFHHSPRLSITSVVDDYYANYRNRPLVRRPFKNDGNFSRVETVTADALNFAWPVRASLVVTNAMIKMIELGVSELPTLKDPVFAASVVGRYGNDVTINVVRNCEPISVRPLEVMTEICERALVEHDEFAFLDKESIQVLEEIIDVSDRMAIDPDSVANQVESIARRLFMKKKMEKSELDIGSEAMCRFDYAWDKLSGGIAERLREKNLAGWQGFDKKYSPKDKTQRIVTPPRDTRAHARGNVIKIDKGKNDSSWSEIEMKDPEEEMDSITTMHPLDNGDGLMNEI